MDNYIYNEFAVSSGVNTPHATLDEVVNIGNNIWNEVKDVKESNELEKIQTKYSDFTNSFPLVLRWMVQMNKYNEGVFRKYLMKHSTAKLDTREAFLRLQAEYLVLMFRHENKRCEHNKINNYREYVVKMLLDEDKEFIEIQKEVEEEMEKTKKENDMERRKQLYKYFTEKRNFC
jgi:hypothetical protein